MDTKICHQCGREKSVNDFGKHRIEKDGLQSVCRLCKSTNDKEYNERTQYSKVNYVRLNAKTRRIRHTYQEDWKLYFKKRYGENPVCEICNKLLSFDLKGKKNSAHFDHKYGRSEVVTKTPASWYTERPCNIGNQNLWNSCDFGILCGRCNILLPTENRSEWLLKAIEYDNKSKKTLFTN